MHVKASLWNPCPLLSLSLAEAPSLLSLCLSLSLSSSLTVSLTHSLSLNLSLDTLCAKVEQ